MSKSIKPLPDPNPLKIRLPISNSAAVAATLSGSTLMLTPVGAGTATILVSAADTNGNVTSGTFDVTVAAAAAPTITSHPVSQTISSGSTVVFSVTATGAPAPTYQWLRSSTEPGAGTPALIPGATGPTLVLNDTVGSNAALAGNYSVVVKNSAGAVTSNPAALTVITTNDPGRLTNLSVLTDISAAIQDFTVGTVIGPIGVSGTKPLVVRAVGPSLGALGVSGTIGDPQLTLYNGSNQVIAANDNWGGSTALRDAMASVGAFAFTGASSLDAVVNPTGLTWGNYSVKVSGVNGSTGTAIAEIYEAAGTVTPSSPRLINVSVLKQLSVGSSLTLGFTVGGSTAKTVLIRVIGPGLSVVGLTSGTLSDPQLALYDSSSQVIATNDDWGADPQLIAAMSRVGAFSVGSAPTKDAMLLVTLPVPPPQGAGYTAKATGNNGTSGYAIVEVYEVP